MKMKEYVVLVDKDNNPIGTQEKLEAHIKGSLHSAFSIFVFNAQGHLLIQQRSKLKYHTPGLWSNTCCSHPRLDESSLNAVKRRIHEEMGFVCNVSSLFSCYYNLELDNHLIEHENNQLYIGEYNGNPNPNPKEVSNWRWVKLDKLSEEMILSPDRFTPWFILMINQYSNVIENALKALHATIKK